MSKRSISSTVPTSGGSKRPRSSPPPAQQDGPPPCPYPRLESARFPVEILALPHVLKQIDVFLMTENEAAIEAAKKGLYDWLNNLLPTVDDCSVVNAMVEASTHGHVECVELSLTEYDMRELTDCKSWKGSLKAVEAAADNGHLEVFSLLLSEISMRLGNQRDGELCGAAHYALLTAAEHGHLDVLKFTVEFVRGKDYMKYLWDSPALGRAIAGGQKAVMEFLLGLKEFTWDLEDAFVVALNAGDKSLADRIYGLHKQTHKRELFVSLACSEHLDALKYLYENGHNDADMIGDAFERAADWHGTDTLEFLLSTGRVSSNAFERGFERAARSTWDRMNIVPFLLDKKRVSAKVINKAFVAAWRTNFLEMLLEREHIWDESICAVFKKAMGNINEYESRRENAGVQIIELLHLKACIPAETIGKAFVIAATTGQSDLVVLLRGDQRISSRMVGEAFAGSAARENSDMMMSLYDASISPDAIVAAFSCAISHGRIGNVKELAKLLSNQDLVPQELKHKAFMIAAHLRHGTVLQILRESTNANWPLAMLKEALAVAKHDEVKNWIRKVICDQLFDPKTEGLFEMASRLMENQHGQSTTSN